MILPKRDKYVIFGAGQEGRRLSAIIPFELYCFIDNNAENIGDIDGIPVKNPTDILPERDECFIILATYKYTDEFSEQLCKLGLKCNKDFGDYRKYDFSHPLQYVVIEKEISEIKIFNPFISKLQQMIYIGKYTGSVVYDKYERFTALANKMKSITEASEDADTILNEFMILGGGQRILKCCYRDDSAIFCDSDGKLKYCPYSNYFSDTNDKYSFREYLLNYAYFEHFRRFTCAQCLERGGESEVLSDYKNSIEFWNRFYEREIYKTLELDLTVLEDVHSFSDCVLVVSGLGIEDSVKNALIAKTITERFANLGNLIIAAEYPFAIDKNVKLPNAQHVSFCNEKFIYAASYCKEIFMTECVAEKYAKFVECIVGQKVQTLKYRGEQDV